MMRTEAFTSGGISALTHTEWHLGKHVSLPYSSSSEGASESVLPSRSPRLATAMPPPLSAHKKSAGKRSATQQTTMAASSSVSCHSAVATNDPREWILALGQQSTTVDATVSRSSKGTGVDGKNSGGDAKANKKTEERDLSDDATASSTTPPLEERIGLHELKQIMLAFRRPSSSHGTAPPHHVTPSAAMPVQSISAESVPQRKVIKPSATEQRLPYFVASDAQSMLDETLRHVEDLSSTVAGLLATDRGATQLFATSYAGVGSSGDVGSGEEAHALATSGPAAASAPLRSLSREDFTQVMRRAVPSATLLEIRALLAKAIPENQDNVSWNELATFLVTCSRQKADLAMEDQRFMLTSQPSNLQFYEQHSDSITCVAVNRHRCLIVTGCSSGSVRAWSSGSDLAYRGLLLKVDGWIVGLHWGCRGRVLYAITMDRYVYVLEGTTFEVLRVFHGRGIKGTADNLAYAAETIGTLRIGGVALPKHRPLNEGSYGGARLRMSPLSASSPKAKASGVSARARGAARRGKQESGEDHMRRLLSSAMQVRRVVQPNIGEDQTGAVVAAAGTVAAADEAEQILNSDLRFNDTTNTTSLTTSYFLTTANAAEALHQGSSPLTGAGRGPYVAQQVDEGVLTSLVDAVTATAFEESAFQEDMLLLGTSKGDAFLFTLATQNDLAQRRVLVARHVFAQLHRGVITKLEFSHAFNALISSGEDGRVRVTSLVSGQCVRTFYVPELLEQHNSVIDFAVNPQLKMLLTIGPERRALVWEWNQPAPIAVLEPVNRPLCCGAFLDEQLLTVSRDHVLHVYDCKSFRLRQELSLGVAGSLTRLSSATAGGVTAPVPSSPLSVSSALSSFMITRLYADAARQRVWGFGRFPFTLCVKRQVSSDCPVRYRGHHAPVLTALVSRAFGQLVTVGTDGVVMTWTPRSGANEFSFLLSNFSNASAITAAPVPPTAAAVDMLQRRLLTGFPGGMMVAWNILNGQVERVLTAAASWGLSSTPSKPAASATTLTSPRAAALNSNGNGNGRAASASAAVAATVAGVGGGSPHTRASPAAPPFAPRRDVTAVGSFLRCRSLSYLFAVGRVLFVDAVTANTAETAGGAAVSGKMAESSSPQLGEYTTTFPSAWVPQPIYGEITQLLQLSPQHVACGTTSGAVLVYNVLSDCQEGAALWVSESMLYPVTPSAVFLPGTPGSAVPGGGSACGRSASIRREGVGGGLAATWSEDEALLADGTRNGGAMASSRSALPLSDSGALLPDSEATGGSSGGQRGHVTSRTIRLLTLPAVHPRLLVMAQEDGTLSCWHTLRRVCLGAVNLTAVGLECDDDNDKNDNNGGRSVDVRRRDDGTSGTFVFDMDEDEGELLVFGDDEGNVHVCRVGWRVLTVQSEQVAAMSLPNPVLYTPASPQARQRRKEKNSGGGASEVDAEERNTSFTPATASAPDFNEAQRAVPLLRQLERVHVFSSGLVLTGLRIVDAAADTALSLAKAAAAAEEGGRVPPLAGAAPASSHPSTTTTAAPSRQLLIVCTGADHYVRVFTLAGVPIGELGMDEWSATDPRTFRFTGELMGVPAAPLPCSVCGNPTWQRDTKETVEASPCYFNYLADLQATYYPRSGLWSAGSLGNTQHSRASLGALASLRRSVSAAGRGAQVLQFDTLSHLALERASSPSATATQRSTSPTMDRRTLNASLDQRWALMLHTAETITVAERPDKAAKKGEFGGGGEDPPPGYCPLPTVGTVRNLSTRLRRSTRYRYGTNTACQFGVVKPSCPEAVLQAAAAPVAGPFSRGMSISHTQVELPPTSPMSVLPLTEGGAADWMHQELSVSSLPCDHTFPLNTVNAEVVPLATEKVTEVDDHNGSAPSVVCAVKENTENHRNSAVDVNGHGIHATEPLAEGGEEALCGGSSSGYRGGSASTRVPKSSTSTPQEPLKSAGDISASVTAYERQVGASPFPMCVTLPATEERNGHHVFATSDGAPLGVSTTDSARHSTDVTGRCSITTAVPTSPEHCRRPFFPRLPSRTPSSSLPRSTSPSSLVEGRERCSTLVSPLRRGNALQRAKSAAAMRCGTAADGVHHGNRPAGGSAANNATVLALLSRERMRVVENAMTPAAQDQLSAIAMPTLISPAQAVASVTSGVVAAWQSPTKSMASAAAAPAANVQQQIDALMEQRRTKHVCGVPPVAMRKSAEGYVAHLTSQLYVAPLPETKSPALTAKRQDVSSASPRPRQRSHLGQTL
jgi:WD40 repeat protein